MEKHYIIFNPNADLVLHIHLLGLKNKTKNEKEKENSNYIFVIMRNLNNMLTELKLFKLFDGDLIKMHNK